FLSLLFAVPVLGERLEPTTVLFSIAVIATVMLGKRMPAGRPAAPSPAHPRHAHAAPPRNTPKLP
ncbi:MAG: hypothetical protein ABI156_13780, partial [Caldimonas sp.]